jgi:hypothetical protein
MVQGMGCDLPAEKRESVVESRRLNETQIGNKEIRKQEKRKRK